MKSLITTIKTGMQMLLCSICIIACTNEEVLENNPQNYAGKAIDLVVSGPDNHAVSRAANVKETFKKDDIIHISTTFTLIDANKSESTSTAYSCLKYNGTKWNEYDTKTFTWPWNATKASFTAYYIPSAGNYENKDALNKGDLPVTLSALSQQKNGEDPLIATYTDVPAGGSVYLQFNHLLSKVTFKNLDETAKADSFYLMVDCDKKITFTRTDNDKLTHTTSALSGRNFIANASSSSTEIAFLIPELAKDTKIRLARKDMSPYHSLEIPIAFMPGKHYTIDITQLADNDISDSVKEEDWNADATEVTLDATEIGKYLESIRDGKAYSYKDKQILITYQDESYNHIVAQICNVNFNNVEFTPVNIRGNIIFQGNGHKIKKLNIKNAIHANEPDAASGALCKALFGRNAGTIKNLVIETVQMQAGNNDDGQEYAGILTGLNEGIIENVKLQGVTIEDDATTANYIGTVTGSNRQNISNCQVLGDIQITVEQTKTDGIVYIGGLTGSSTGAGKVTNCLVQGNNTKKSITVNGSYNICYIGGMAGLCEDIDNCTTNLNTTINGTSKTNLYTGGFAGAIENAKAVQSNTAIGDVSLGESVSATMGGFAGSLQNSTLHDCAASGNLSYAATSTTVGGLIGNIRCTNEVTVIRYSSATGNVSANDGGFIGTTTKQDTDKGTLTIQNSFCISDADNFIKEDNITATIENCHIKGISTSDNTASFSSSEKYWTNTPAIYGNDTNGNPIYYLKRNLIGKE